MVTMVTTVTMVTLTPSGILLFVPPLSDDIIVYDLCSSPYIQCACFRYHIIRAVITRTVDSWQIKMSWNFGSQGRLKWVGHTFKCITCCGVVRLVLHCKDLPQLAMSTDADEVYTAHGGPKHIRHQCTARGIF